MTVIKGAGTSGYGADVNELGELLVTGPMEPSIASTSKREGLAFIFSSLGVVALTTGGGESGMLYIKNTDPSRDLELHDIRVSGDVIHTWQIYVGDTAGTLISTATPGGEFNLNRTRSSRVALADVFKGEDGLTRSGGTLMGQSITGVGSYNIDLHGAFILGNNDSVVFTCTPAENGNAAIDVTGHYL